MDHIIELADRAWFKRCRRAWDLRSGARQNYEPVDPAHPFDTEGALQEALAAYYYPAMSGWSRALVRPIATETFVKAMRTQRGGSLRSHDSAFPEDACAREIVLGRRMLDRYFAWAETVDDFSAVRAGADFDVVVPDPARTTDGLLAPDGGAIRLRGRVGLLVTDEHGRLWLVEHRFVDRGAGGDWTELDVLRLDEMAGTLCWASESQWVAKVAGVIFTELRLEEPGVGAAGTAGAAPPQDQRRGAVVVEDPAGQFRRTRIRKSPTELRQLRRQLAAEALEMVGNRVAVYPSPSPAACRACPYRAPCLAMHAGEDAGPILEASYRRRVPEVIPLPPRTGSCGPQVVHGWKTKGPGVPQKT